jgi:nicotinamide-nucleotide amidase
MAEALEPALPPEVDRLAQSVLGRAHDLDLKLVTAESCTGGLLASLLTDVAGKSHTFERGFVTYSNDAKHEVLGVSFAILDGPGAVSKACAMAMAEGALGRSRGALAAAITGYTEGGPGQPAGLVHFACARRGKATTHRVMLFGDIGRAQVRIRALETALGMMLDQMLQSPSADAVSAWSAHPGDGPS